MKILIPLLAALPLIAQEAPQNPDSQNPDQATPCSCNQCSGADQCPSATVAAAIGFQRGFHMGFESGFSQAARFFRANACGKEGKGCKDGKGCKHAPRAGAPDQRPTPAQAPAMPKPISGTPMPMPAAQP